MSRFVNGSRGLPYELPQHRDRQGGRRASKIGFLAVLGGGLLVRDRRGLEEARNLNTVVFDKTGTLTLGSHRVVDMTVVEGMTEEDALRIGGGVESESEHPIARGVVQSAIDRGIDVPSADNFRAITGKGVAASLNGAEYHIGGPALLKSESASIPDRLTNAAERAAERGQAAIYLLEDGNALAVFAVADAVREESHEAVRALRERGIEVAMPPVMRAPSLTQ